MGCVNVRGWNVEKMEDLSREMNDWMIDVVGLTETQLRERVELNSREYRMIGKGRSKQQKKGGGVGVLVRMEAGIDVEEIEVGDCEMSEDVMAVRLEYRAHGQKERLIVIVCYMTVNGTGAKAENEKKYGVIQRLVEKFKDERLIVMGDMNGHVGVLGENVNVNGQMLLDFAEAQDLEILNVTIAEGRVTWSGRDSESAIDYMLVNEKARERVTKMWIDEKREIDVASDHNVMVIEFECMKEGKIEEKKDEKNTWKMREADWDKFREAFERETGMTVQYENNLGVDEMNERLGTRINRAAESSVGKTRKREKNKRKESKRWWNEKIERARKERKQLNRECRNLRRRRENSEEECNEYERIWNKYRGKQKEVKNLIRKARVNEDREIIRKLRSTGENGGRDWYRFLRGEERKQSESVDELVVNGETIKEKEKMVKAVEDFWMDIGGINEPERELGAITMARKIEEYMDDEISIEEIEKYVKKLKNGKAPGMDGIPNEFYKEGGQGMLEEMHEMFACIWREERVPAAWNESRVTLIHKGGHKSKKEVKNYRPIAVCDTLCKVFCGILNERLSGIVERNNVMGEEQNGFLKDRRGEDNMFVVNEVIERAKKEGEKKYLAFLDIEKAYDKVRRDMLCKVLEIIGMSEKVVRIIRSMYENTRAKYSMGDIKTDWVYSKRGVRQGCVLSPLLFGLYVEELAVRVKRTGLGVKIGNDVLSVLMYADDVVLLSNNHTDLQVMLNAVSEYGEDYGVRFSKEKSQVLIINGDNVDSEREWMLGGNEIKTTKKYKYLGMWLDEKGYERTKHDRISRANQWMGRLGSVARCRANKYEIVRGLWKGMAVPSIMYGLETTVWTKNELERMEVIQNKVGRIALGANRYTAVEAIRGDMGWSTFRERLAKAVLRYRVRLHRMDENRWAKKVFEWNIYGRWMKDSIKTEMWAGELGMLVRGVMRQGSMDACKRELNNKVEEKGRNEWKCKMSGKSTLEWYRGKDRPGYESCYDGSYGSDLLFKARTKSLELNSRVYRWTNGGSKTCIVCESGEDETIEHMITECDRYVDARARMLNIVKEQIGVEEWNRMSERNDNTEVKYLLCLHIERKCTVQVTECVKDYLESAWRTRARVIERRRDQQRGGGGNGGSAV